MKRDISLIVSAANKQDLLSLENKITTALERFGNDIVIEEHHLEQSMGISGKELALTFIISIAANFSTDLIKDAVKALDEQGLFTVELIVLDDPDNSPDLPGNQVAVVDTKAGKMKLASDVQDSQE
jgi:hypothetical protein